MRFLSVLALAIGAWAPCSALAALAAPPTNEQIDRAVEAYRSQSGAEHTRDDPRIGQLLKDLSIAEMSAAQFERLGIMLDLAPRQMRARFRERLEQIARDDRSVNGAAAAAQIVRLFELPGDDAGPEAAEQFERDRADALIAAARHPGYAEAVKAGRGTLVYTYLFFYAANERIVKSGIASTLASHVNDNWSEEHLDDLLAFTEAIVAPEAGLPRTEIDRVRAIATRIAQKVIARPGTDEPKREMLLQVVGNLNSAAAKGELVGGIAPAMQFLWCSAKQPARSLADLRGKVVVLDFWATWCGPCIAAFPHMRQMHVRYRGKPVEIVGVTSLQGWILDAKAKDPAKRRIKDLSPDDELKRLATWATEMDMTWTVAVSKQPVFNPEYGVRGLPTVVIIDAKGVVRHAGLSPTDERLNGFVDALLVEMGESAPAESGK